jgi:hypothetical protein
MHAAQYQHSLASFCKTNGTVSFSTIITLPNFEETTSISNKVQGVVGASRVPPVNQSACAYRHGLMIQAELAARVL